MAENSGISWTDHTFNPWIGCAKVSPACDGCYAEALMGGAGRFTRVQWGAPGKGEGTRDRTAASTWKQPRKWDRAAALTYEQWARDPIGKPPATFVFCASLADVFDNAVPPEWRRDLFDMIRATPNLTWLLLTKRPGNIVKLFRETLPPAYGPDGEEGDWYLPDLWPRNTAIGCTVVSQEEADRDVPKLLAAKAALRPAFAFLSMEPLLGAVDLTRIPVTDTGGHVAFGAFVDWVIAGGETDQAAHKARPADPAWFRSLRDQCAAAGVPFHFKQWGEWVDSEELLLTELGIPQKGAWDDATGCIRVGKNLDPFTLDGVLHQARPDRRQLAERLL